MVPVDEVEADMISLLPPKNSHSSLVEVVVAVEVEEVAEVVHPLNSAQSRNDEIQITQFYRGQPEILKKLWVSPSSDQPG